MPSIWSKLFRGSEERAGVDDLAQMYNSYFSFNGISYPIGMGMGSPMGAKAEQAPNDFESYVKGIYKTSGPVFSVAIARQLVFTEMRFVYQSMKGGRAAELFGSKQLSILENPWPNGTTGDLLSRALQQTDIAGNHYVVQEGVGSAARPYRLRILRPDWTDIILTAPPEDGVKSDIAGYLYRPGGTQDRAKWSLYPIDGSKGAVAHWAPIPDPEAQYRGMSWMTPIIHEVMADKGASTHKQKFFDQGATPQVAVSFKDTVTPEQFREFMKDMDRSHHGVQDAYKTMYVAGGADVRVVGAHLNQLNFHDMQGHLETRIAAAGQIHPVLVGFQEAIKGAPMDIGNYQAAKDMFGDKTLRPLWRSLCGAYAPLVPSLGGSRLWFDDRDISFLRQDRQAQADLLLSQANTANTLMMAGFEPDSIQKFLISDGDWSVLSHTGLTSVQLLPPGQSHGTGDTPEPGRPVPPVPDPKFKGQKSVTPVPKEPKMGQPPKSPLISKPDNAGA